MDRLRNVKLNAEQLQWLINVDYVGYYHWNMHKSAPNSIYMENAKLKIQVTKDRSTNTFTIWTWE